jgi:hypothetical protein
MKYQRTPGRAKSEHQADRTHRLIADVNGTLFAVLGVDDTEVDSLFTLSSPINQTDQKSGATITILLHVHITRRAKVPKF